jgi:hypothetical protein
MIKFPIYVSTNKGHYYCMVISENKEIMVSAKTVHPHIQENEFTSVCVSSFDALLNGEAKRITKEEFEKNYFAALDMLTKTISQFDKVEA